MRRETLCKVARGITSVSRSRQREFGIKVTYTLQYFCVFFMAHSNFQVCIAGPARVFDSIVFALHSYPSIIKCNHKNKFKKNVWMQPVMQAICCISLFLAGTAQLLAIPVTSRSIVSGVRKYGFRSCCPSQYVELGLRYVRGRLACIFQRGFERFTALLRYHSNANCVRFLFTVIPSYWLQSHYGNQPEKVHCMSVSRERIVGINCVLYKDSRKNGKQPRTLFAIY